MNIFLRLNGVLGILSFKRGICYDDVALRKASKNHAIQGTDIVMNKWIFKLTSYVLLALASTSVVALPLPGSVEPARVESNYLPPPPASPLPAPSITHEEKATDAPLGKEAEKITFVLKKIVITGNHVYTQKQLSAIYKDKLHKKISVADLFKIVDSITSYYRNNGYILSQAVLPPQRIAGGTVTIRVVEGYIHKVKIVGNPRGAHRLILAYGKEIAKLRPLKIQTMEYYLYLANQIPGAEVRAVLEPSKTNTGASDLNLVVKEDLITGTVSYDDYGTRYLGPQQITSVISFNSIFLPGDTTRLLYLTTTQGKELRYGDISYTMPIGLKGLTLTVDGNKSLTNPGFVLEPLDTRGLANTYSISVQYPIILTASENLSVSGNFTYLNSRSTQLGFLLYDDRIRPIQFGVTYQFSDKYKGSNQINAQVEKGLNVFDASSNPNSFQSSRFGADGIYTNISAQVSRTQALFDRFSAYFVAQGQYSFSPLLSAEQFGFGGSQLGRGYDPAEILGDSGAAGSVELRMDNYPDKFKISMIQMYMFYDAGVIWNRRDLPGAPTKQSATSAGMGFRLAFNKYVSGNFMIAQPLTKQVAAQEIIHKGRDSRTFFSIVANFP